MKHTRGYLDVGPGGMKCPCCMPAPGGKARKGMFRTAKRRSARAWKNEVKNALVCD